MKRLFICLSLLLGLVARAPAQPGAPTVPPADLTQLRASLAGLPDSVQFQRVKAFAREKAGLGQRDLVPPILELSLAIARRSGSPRLLGQAWQGLGYWAALAGDYPTALRYYHLALNLAQAKHDYRLQAQVLQRLGNVYAQLHDWPHAEQYLRQALAVVEQYAVAAEQASVYNELAILASSRQQPAQAVRYSQQALALHRAAGRWADYYQGLISHAIILKDLGHYRQAEQALRETLAYFQQHPNRYLESFVYYNLPDVLLQERKIAEAEHYAQLALARARADQQQPALTEIYSTLTRIKEAQQDYRQALAYSRLATAHRDTLLEANKGKELAELEARYQARQQQARISRLGQDNARQQRQLWRLSLGAAALLALLGLALWQYRLIRRANTRLESSSRIIAENNHHIEEQSARLVTLLREVHHRVKNNLAIVASLLRLQSNRLTDVEAARAVREGQQRVEAMSLIHQRLHQTDDVTTIDMRHYVTDLVESLRTAYRYPGDTLDLRLDVAPLTLDVDVAMPLGLVLNELLTNVFKHAYPTPDGSRPALHVALTPTPTGGLRLLVQDNGPGLSVLPEPTNTGSFGRRLVASLSEQLGGYLSTRNGPGTCYELLLPSRQLAPA